MKNSSATIAKPSTKVSTPKTKAAPKPKAKVETIEIAEPIEVRTPVYNEEQLLEYKKELRGKAVTFTPFGRIDKLSGTVKNVIMDKRVNKVYAQIWVGEGEATKLYHKAVHLLEIVKAPK
jgi:hypothetical protein